MIKLNLNALLFHVVFLLVCIPASLILVMILSQPDWFVYDMLKNHSKDEIGLVLVAVWLVLIAAAYLLIGFRYLFFTPDQLEAASRLSFGKRLLSVSSVSIIGLLVSAFPYVFTFKLILGTAFLYLYPFVPALLMFQNKVILFKGSIYFLCSLIPSVFLFIGMSLRCAKFRKTNRSEPRFREK